MPNDDGKSPPLSSHVLSCFAYSGHRPVSERTRVHSEAGHECAQNCAPSGLQSQLEHPSAIFSSRYPVHFPSPSTHRSRIRLFIAITGACFVQFDELLLIVEIRRTAEYHTITEAYYLPEPVLLCICTPSPTAATPNNHHIRVCSPQAISTLSSLVSRRFAATVG